AYDADLIAFSKHAHDSLQLFRVQATSNPTAKTDIFGAIKMALEELASGPKEQDRELFIFSDFIEDDGTVNFNNDPRLISTTTAIYYAAEKARSSLPRDGLPIHAHLGLLRSKELHVLSKGRREAMKQFWLQYLRSYGVKPVWTTDGVGLLMAGF